MEKTKNQNFYDMSFVLFYLFAFIALLIFVIYMVFFWFKDYPRLTDNFEHVQTHNVDQIFRDHNGYRILYDDSNGKIHEVKYLEVPNYMQFPRVNTEDSSKFLELETSDKHINIYHDL